MTFGEILYQLRKKKGLHQEDIALKMGVKKNTISNYENNSSKPNYDKLVKLCNLFQVSPNNLMDDDLEIDNELEIPLDIQQLKDKYDKLSDHDRSIVDYIFGMEEESAKPTKIYYFPVYQQNVAAGTGQLGFDQKHTMEEFSKINMPKKISYGIRIKGVSMETDDEYTIPDKSTVLVTTEFDYDELLGEAVIVNINGVLVCKEYNIEEDGHIWLKSRNRSKSDEDRHIHNMDGVKIIGKVVKVIYP